MLRQLREKNPAHKSEGGKQSPLRCWNWHDTSIIMRPPPSRFISIFEATSRSIVTVKPTPGTPGRAHTDAVPANFARLVPCSPQYFDSDLINVTRVSKQRQQQGGSRAACYRYTRRSGRTVHIIPGVPGVARDCCLLADLSEGTSEVSGASRKGSAVFLITDPWLATATSSW